MMHVKSIGKDRIKGSPNSTEGRQDTTQKGGQLPNPVTYTPLNLPPPFARILLYDKADGTACSARPRFYAAIVGIAACALLMRALRTVIDYPILT